MEAWRCSRIVLKAVETTNASSTTMNDPTEVNARAHACFDVIMWRRGFPPVPTLSINSSCQQARADRAPFTDHTVNGQR
jgi:hypothetical protein